MLRPEGVVNMKASDRVITEECNAFVRQLERRLCRRGEPLPQRESLFRRVREVIAETLKGVAEAR